MSSKTAQALIGRRNGWVYLECSRPARYVAIQMSRVDMWAITPEGQLTVWAGGTTFTGDVPADGSIHATACTMGAPSLSHWGNWLVASVTLPCLELNTPRPLWVQALLALALVGGGILVPMLLLSTLLHRVWM